MTSYEQLYVPFFNRIEEDANFFSYYKIREILHFIRIIM